MGSVIPGKFSLTSVMSLLRLCVLLPSLSITQAFHTDSCSHQDLLNVENAFRDQLKQHGRNRQVCNYFRIVDTAYKEEYSVCFSKEQVEHFSLMERVLIKNHYEEISSPEEMETLKPKLDSCDVVPTEEEVDILGRKNWALVWLDEVETDNNCSDSEKDWLQSVHGTCLTNWNRIFGKSLHCDMVASDICTMMTDTIGHCLHIQMPPCYSRREANFLAIKIREMARLGLHWWKEDVPGIETEGKYCSVWERHSLYSGSGRSSDVVAWVSVCVPTIVFSLLSNCKVM